MSWRTVLVTKKAKLSYKNAQLIIRGEDTHMIALSEINTIVVDTTEVSITAYLISELIKEKIKIVFCDEKRNPQGEIVPYYGSHNTSKKIHLQASWDSVFVTYVWTNVIYQKISNQSDLLKKFNIKGWEKICEYMQELKINDPTNREGHAAKVYFNALFGNEFNRNADTEINAALNYGYSILLSNFNKEIVACGYITQLGLKHCNEFNQFNLSSDLMEPFRILIDEIVYENKEEQFNGKYKHMLLDVLNKKVVIDKKEQYLTNAIGIYVRSIFKAIERSDLTQIKYFDFV